MEKAKKAMVPPFEISIFADPGGSFTTAAAMIGIDDNIGGILAIKDKKDSLTCLMTSHGELSLFHTDKTGHFSSNLQGI